MTLTLTRAMRVAIVRPSAPMRGFWEADELMKSRSRQGCCWTIGALCCACALSACRHSNGEMILPERGQKQLESIDQGAPATSETGQRGESFRAKNDSSAYQEKSTTLCAPEKPTSHLLVHDTTYPDP